MPASMNTSYLGDKPSTSVQETENDNKYRMMLRNISKEMEKRNVSLDMLKFVLFDFVKTRQLENAKKSFDIFLDLDKARHISKDDISLLSATFELLELPAMKTTIANSRFSNVVVQPSDRFSSFRISAIIIGNRLNDNDISVIAGVYNVPQKLCSNKWKLLQHLEFTGRLKNEENLNTLAEIAGIKKALPETMVRSGEGLKVFQHEVEKGKTTIVNLNVVFLGKEKTGKTSCVDCILDAKIELDNTIKWRKWNVDAFQLTKEIYEHALAENVAKRLKIIGINPEIASDQSTSNESMSVTSSLKDERNFSSFGKRETSLSKKMLNKAAAEMIPDSIYQKIVDYYKLNVGSTVNHQRGTASVLDNGGHLQNYTTHQFFLTSRSSYNVVFSALEKLDDITKPFSSDKFEATNLQMILFSIRTVYEHAVLNSAEKPRLLNRKIDSPPITLVATHKDQIDNSEAKDMVKTILQAIKDMPYKMHVDPDVYAVDNTNPKDEGIQKLKRNTCKYMKDMEETVPVCWVDFQSKIEAAGKTKLYLPLVEITKIAADCRISETNLPSVLHYLNDIGVIFYSKINKKLKDSVIVNLYKLTDMIMRITTLKTHCPLMTDSWNDFDIKGILDEELLYHLWEPEIEHDPSNFDVALEFMKMLGLIFEKGFHQGKRQFLVPSRSKEVKKPSLKVKKDQKQSVSIYVTPTDILPNTIDGVLVVGFLKLMKCKGRNLENLVLYQNCNDFDLYDDHLVRLGEVGIGNRRALKLEISRKNLIDEKISEPFESVCIEVVTYLKEQLKNVCCTVEDVGYELSVFCNACDPTDQPHFHKFNECVEKGFVICDSKVVDTSRFKYLFTTDSQEFGSKGGKLMFNDITLEITENAINEGEKVKVYITTIKNEEISILKPTEACLSPVVFCGPPGTVFNKPCVLSFPHNIVDEKIWKFKGLVKDRLGGEWKEIRNDENFCCSVKNGRCFIKLKHFTYYALGGDSSGGDISDENVVTRPVHMKVSDYWHKFLPNTYEICVEMWQKDCNKPKDPTEYGVYYTYGLVLDSVNISVERISEAWKAEPRQQTLNKSLVWERYAAKFQLTTETKVKNKKPPCCRVWLEQNGVKLKPYVTIPQSNGSQTQEAQSADEDSASPDNMQDQTISSSSKEFDILLSAFSKQYKGSNYKKLRFLLYDSLPLNQLSQRNPSALELIKQLEVQDKISHDNIEILSEIAELTNLKLAKSCIAKYKKMNTRCTDGQALKQHRKTLFRTLMQVENIDLPDLVASYNLIPYKEDINDLWDLVFRLEKTKLLNNTPDKWKRFANRLNKTAEEIMLKDAETTEMSVVMSTDTKGSRNEKAILVEAAERIYQTRSKSKETQSKIAIRAASNTDSQYGSCCDSISGRLRKRKYETLPTESYISDKNEKHLSTVAVKQAKTQSKHDNNTTSRKRKSRNSFNKTLHPLKRTSRASINKNCGRSQIRSKNGSGSRRRKLKNSNRSLYSFKKN